MECREREGPVSNPPCTGTALAEKVKKHKKPGRIPGLFVLGVGLKEE